jgi:4-amino-4-deoxy-L-arabinose transferase-like glycosyltransferase
MSVAASVAEAERSDEPARRSGGRRSRTALVVALLAALNALGWGLIVAPYHVPDEPSHAFYAQYLGETGKLPQLRAENDWYSDDINAMLTDAGFYFVIGQPINRPPWDSGAQRRLAADQAADLDRVGRGDASTASNNPPLYYAAQAAVYRAAHGLGPLNRLSLMRVLAAVLAGLTALCVFCFIRELLPARPLAWTTGALAAGLQPMFAFMSSGVNNDGALYLASSALFLALAILLRRGLTPRRAAAVGLALGAGILIKTQVAAFVPAVGLALLISAWRVPAGRLRGLAAGVGAGAAPLALYGVLGSTVWDRPLLDRAGDVTLTSSTARPFALMEQISYLWQEYLPRLPFMTDLLPGVQPWQLWFKGFIGRFGWLDYQYPAWVYTVALVAVAALVAAAAVNIWQRRSALRGRLAEIIVFTLAAIGFMTAIAVVSYRFFLIGGGFEQARYIIPLLPLFALVPALAVRAVSPRMAPVLATAIVTATLGLSLYGQLLTIARYYG